MRWTIVAAGLLGLAVPASAAPADPTGYQVSPAYQELHFAADNKDAVTNLQIRNRTATAQTFKLSVVDFGALDEEGGVAFMGTPSSELEHRYGLASWMTLDRSEATVPPGGSVSVLATVNNRDSLKAGGHYGAILATALTDKGGGAGNSVGIKQVLSSLVLAYKDGGVRQRLILKSQKTNAAFWRLPDQAEHRFFNAGNVHIVPRGVVSVVDPAGREIARGALNEESGTVLPEAIRRYRTKLDTLEQAWWPGQYNIVTSYRFDGTEDVQISKVSIWYVGAGIVWGAVALVIITIVALVFGWWWVRKRLLRRDLHRLPKI